MEPQELQKLTGVGPRGTGHLICPSAPKHGKQTADIQEGSPWVMKSTLLNSTKPKSQIPTSTNEMAFTESLQHAKRCMAQPGHLKTKNTASLGAKFHIAASTAQVLPPTILAGDLQQSFSSGKMGPVGLRPTSVP